jgi:ribose 1,5-bisphosphokinase
MNRRLIYVVGPSGAGKDSLLSWLRAQTPASAPVYWTRRTIDRPPSEGADAEKHEPVDALAFEQLVSEDAFAMHWQANTHRYGIRKSELAGLADSQHCVMVNGSRAHIPVAAHDYPGMTVLHITAAPEVLRQRLLGRGRESAQAIEARLQRAVDLQVPSGCRLLEISNDTTLAEAGQTLLMRLQNAELWPIKSM